MFKHTKLHSKSLTREQAHVGTHARSRNRAARPVNGASSPDSSLSDCFSHAQRCQSFFFLIFLKFLKYQRRFSYEIYSYHGLLILINYIYIKCSSVRFPAKDFVGSSPAPPPPTPPSTGPLSPRCQEFSPPPKFKAYA